MGSLTLQHAPFIRRTRACWNVDTDSEELELLRAGQGVLSGLRWWLARHKESQLTTPEAPRFQVLISSRLSAQRTFPSCQAHVPNDYDS